MFANLFVKTGGNTGYNVFTHTLINGLRKELNSQNLSFREKFNLIPQRGSDSKDTFLKQDLELGSLERMADISVQISPFGEQLFFHGKTRVGFPMYEGSILDKHTKEMLNTLDYIIAPCTHLYELYKRELKAKPLLVMAGVDTKVFQNYSKKALKRNQVEPYSEENPCVFLVVGKYEKRKASIEILEAFLSMFEQHPMREKVILKLKWLANCYSRTLTQIKKETKDLFEKYPKAGRRVVIIDNPRISMVKEYNDADCVIMASKAEGIGLPLLEAMACEVPVISTVHTSLKDFVCDNGNIIINCRETEPMRDEFYGIKPEDWGEMGVVKVEDLKEAMTKFMEMSHQERLSIGEFARAHIVNNFSSEKMGKRFLEALDVIRNESKESGDADCRTGSCCRVTGEQACECRI